MNSINSCCNGVILKGLNKFLPSCDFSVSIGKNNTPNFPYLLI